MRFLILSFIILVYSCGQKVEEVKKVETLRGKEEYTLSTNIEEYTYESYPEEECYEVPQCPPFTRCGMGVCETSSENVSECIKNAEESAKSQLISQLGTYIHQYIESRKEISPARYSRLFKIEVKERNLVKLLPPYNIKLVRKGKCIYAIASVSESEFDKIIKKIYKNIEADSCIKKTSKKEKTLQNLKLLKNCFNKIDCYFMENFLELQDAETYGILTCNYISKVINRFESETYKELNCRLVQEINEELKNAYKFNFRISKLLSRINYKYFCYTRSEFENIIGKLLKEKLFCDLINSLGSSYYEYIEKFGQPDEILNKKYRNLMPFAVRYSSYWVIFDDNHARCVVRNPKTTVMAGVLVPLPCTEQNKYTSCPYYQEDINSLCGCH